MCVCVIHVRHNTLMCDVVCLTCILILMLMYMNYKLYICLYIYIYMFFIHMNNIYYSYVLIHVRMHKIEYAIYRYLQILQITFQ